MYRKSGGRCAYIPTRSVMSLNMYQASVRADALCSGRGTTRVVSVRVLPGQFERLGLYASVYSSRRIDRRPARGVCMDGHSYAGGVLVIRVPVPCQCPALSASLSLRLRPSHGRTTAVSARRRRPAAAESESPGPGRVQPFPSLMT
jgi:hypothetical protein